MRQYVHKPWKAVRFTHVATPEENSYIGRAAEAGLSQYLGEVIESNKFGSYYDAKNTIKRFITHYNYHRLHRSIGFMTTQQKWEEVMICDSIILDKMSN